MKRTHAWHDTPVGQLVCWLGSIQFAIPILAMVTAAMIWGTFLESTQDAKVARAAVYGAWWFMVLMGLVCISLVFAVITRFPWKAKHLGFIVVHASLVAMIVAGFWSMLGRVEGHIALEQGLVSGTIEMDQERIELVEHDAGQFRTLGEIDAPRTPGKYMIGGFPVEIVDVMDNVREDFEITDDGADPYRAVQFQFGPMAESAVWVGEESRGPAPVLDGLKIRILSSGMNWQAPEPKSVAAAQSDYMFLLGEQKIPLAPVGQEAFTGWKVVNIKRYANAIVQTGGLSENSAQGDNPAIEVTITDGQGTTEVHTAFAKFPDMILAKTLEGSGKSGARLAPPAKATPHGTEETVVIYGTPPAMKVAYLAADGGVKLLENPGTYPWTADFGDRKLLILKQFTKAREQSRFSRIPSAKEHRPAIVFKNNKGENVTVAWKSSIPLELPGRVAMLRFNPKTVALPFSLRLDKFRKSDYPGTDMAMAYESDITAFLPDASEKKTTISMNNPLVQSGWKVYQSGFMGNTVSIFSVMRDPGLMLTYLSSLTLCLGILITFYGRNLSWGHPGIPLPFAKKEASNATIPDRIHPVAHPAMRGTSGPLVPAVDPAPGSALDPGRRESDAAGYVRA